MNREAEKRASFRREQKARMRVENPERARREDNASLARSRATSRLVAAYRAEFDSYITEELEKLASASTSASTSTSTSTSENES